MSEDHFFERKQRLICAIVHNKKPKDHSCGADLRKHMVRSVSKPEGNLSKSPSYRMEHVVFRPDEKIVSGDAEVETRFSVMSSCAVPFTFG